MAETGNKNKQWVPIESDPELLNKVCRSQALPFSHTIPLIHMRLALTTNVTLCPDPL
jgi:hypothetical protein